MTKEDFKQYKNLAYRRKYFTGLITRLERKAANVPTVKDKVQASDKEFPYTLTHVTVDAPAPVQYTTIQRDLFRARRQLELIESLLDELVAIFEQIEDGRTVQMLTERYIYGEKLSAVAAHFDLTEQAVLKIINDAVKKL